MLKCNGKATRNMLNAILTQLCKTVTQLLDFEMHFAFVKTFISIPKITLYASELVQVNP